MTKNQILLKENWTSNCFIFLVKLRPSKERFQCLSDPGFAGRIIPLSKWFSWPMVIVSVPQRPDLVEPLTLTAQRLIWRLYMGWSDHYLPFLGWSSKYIRDLYQKRSSTVTFGFMRSGVRSEAMCHRSSLFWKVSIQYPYSHILRWWLGCPITEAKRS